MAQAGKITRAALLEVKYTLSPSGIPFFTTGDQDNPQPELTILTETEDFSGRLYLSNMIAGADNGVETQALINAWAVITSGIHGRFKL